MDEHNINNFCQFCLEEQSIRSQKVPIDREVKRKFHDLTALKLSTNKFCEFICCEPCLTSLESAVKFRETLIRNQEILAENLKKQEQRNSVNEIDEDQMIEESIQTDEDDVTSEITIIEALESETEDTFEISLTHDESHTIISQSGDSTLKKKYQKKRLKDPISCPKCDRQFYYKAYLQFHYKDVHSEDREEVCQFCGKVFKNSRRLNSHLLVHQNDAEKRHKCETCGKQFNFSGDLIRHKRVHDNIKPFKCNLCTKSFVQSYALKLHLDVHNNVRFSCDLCGVSFSGKPSLKKHIAKCASGQENVKSSRLSKHNSKILKINEKYKCVADACDRQFSSRKYLKVHLEKLHDMKFDHFETTCLECLKVFDNVGDYSIHVKTHSCNHVCNMCKLRYRTQAKLQAHIEKTHKEGESRPFVCSICEAKFKRAEHLRGHMNYKHSTKKEIKCTMCSLSFRQPGELRTHERVHLNQTPFSCWQCSHKCKTSSNLRQHMSLVHDEKFIYYCKSCKMSFQYNTELNKHNKTVHSE